MNILAQVIPNSSYYLLLQGIATSIDALSVSFTISHYNWIMALVCSLIIAAVTFIICFAGVVIGKKFGTWLSNKACFLGGAILIFIGKYAIQYLCLCDILAYSLKFISNLKNLSLNTERSIQWNHLI